MKTSQNTILLLALFFISLDSLAQKVGDKIKLTTHCKTSIAAALPLSNDTIIAEYLEPNIIFTVNKITDSEVLLIALNFSGKVQDEINNSSNNEEYKPPTKAQLYNYKIYKISRSDFDKAYKPYEAVQKLSIGLLTLPFKARPQDDFTFDTEFNLSSTLNYNLLKRSSPSLNIQIGAGIGSVNLNSVNSDGVTTGKEQDVATLTFFGGLMVEYKSVQAGLYLGVDQINNQSTYRWKNNGNIWFGFGIGFNVFKVSVAEKTSN